MLTFKTTQNLFDFQTLEWLFQTSCLMRTSQQKCIIYGLLYFFLKIWGKQSCSFWPKKNPHFPHATLKIPSCCPAFTPSLLLCVPAGSDRIKQKMLALWNHACIRLKWTVDSLSGPGTGRNSSFFPPKHVNRDQSDMNQESSLKKVHSCWKAPIQTVFSWGTCRHTLSCDSNRKRLLRPTPDTTEEDEEGRDSLCITVADWLRCCSENSFFVRTGLYFYFKRRIENDTDSFSLWKRSSHFTLDWLWQEFS